MLRASASEANGSLDLDEDFLRRVEGVTDFSKYSVIEGAVPRRSMPAKLPDLAVAEQMDEGWGIPYYGLAAVVQTDQRPGKKRDLQYTSGIAEQDFGDNRNSRDVRIGA